MKPGHWTRKNADGVRAVIDTRSLTVEIPAGKRAVKDMLRLKDRLKAAVPGFCVSHLSYWMSGAQTTGTVHILVDDTATEPSQVLTDAALLKVCAQIVSEELTP
jgi:hypothetical protein